MGLGKVVGGDDGITAGEVIEGGIVARREETAAQARPDHRALGQLISEPKARSEVIFGRFNVGAVGYRPKPGEKNISRGWIKIGQASFIRRRHRRKEIPAQA